MFNFKKLVSVSAVAILGVTNLLAPLSYANAATGYDALSDDDLKQRVLLFMMPAKDVYLYAHTAANHYFVQYSGTTKTAGSMANSEYIYDLTGSLSGNTYTKLGYTFQHWEDGSGNTYPDQATVFNWTAVENGIVPIYAQWSANRYNITYNLNDSAGTSSGVHSKTPNSGAYDESLTILNPSRTGYTFSGWDITNMDSNPHTVGGKSSSATSATGVTGTSFENLRATSGTVNFLAQWSANPDTQYLVKHFLQELDGSYPGDPKTIDELSGTTDQTVTPAIHSYTGFTADPTTTPSSGNIKADGSTIFTYKYTRNPYNLTLIAGTGVESVKGTGTINTAGGTYTTSGTITFKYDEPVKLSFVLKDGYQTGTWSGYETTSSSFNMPAENISKTAYATPITYTITYHNYGGEGNEGDPTTYTIETPTITLSNLTRDHSEFEGWTGTNVASPTKGVTIPKGSTGNKVYHAVWSCIDGYHTENTGANNESCQADTNTKYLVNHIQQDLSGNDTIYIETGYQYGKTDTTTAVTGHSYEGFEVREPITQKNINGDGTTVINVYYNRLSYAGTVNSATGVTSPSAVGDNSGASPFKYEDTVRLSATVQSGYTWSGWTVTDASGNSVTVSDATPSDPNGATFKMPASSVTITPHVTRNTYTIEYELYSGTVGVANPTSYNVESAAITLNKPSRPHSVFEGWTGTELSGTTQPVIIAHGSVGNRKYYAVWSCVAGYHDEGGTSCVANDYTVTIDYADGDHGTTESVPFTYDDPQTISNPQQSGYDFVGWTIEGLTSGAKIDGVTVTGTTLTGVKGTEFENLTTVSGGTVTFTAVWEARDDTKYVVHHYYENLAGTAYVESGSYEYSGNVTVPVVFSDLVKNYSGYTYANEGYLTGGTTRPTSGGITQVNIDKHGTTEIYLYYTRDSYHVYLSGDAHVDTLTGEGTYRYGADVTVTATAKTGYHFVRWEKKNSF